MGARCSSRPPKVDVQIWAGWPERSGIVREQEKKFIHASDPAFGRFAALSYTDLKKIFDLINLCEKWPGDVALMNNAELSKALKIYKDVSREASKDGPQP